MEQHLGSQIEVTPAMIMAGASERQWEELEKDVLIDELKDKLSEAENLIAKLKAEIASIKAQQVIDDCRRISARKRRREQLQKIVEEAVTKLKEEDAWPSLTDP